MKNTIILIDKKCVIQGGSIISFDFGLGQGLTSVMRKRSNTYYYHQTETTPLLFDDSLNKPRVIQTLSELQRGFIAEIMIW